MRFNLSINKDIIAQVQKAAAEEGAKRGKSMSIAEWIREAVVAKLGR